MNEFLKLEYEQCLSLIKYYDERHHSLVKYSSGLSSAVPSLLLAVYQLSGSAVNYFWQFTTIISVVTTIGLLSLFTVLIQNRLYFIYPARQVNSIRKNSLENLVEENFENQMYLNTTFNAFKWSSSQTLLNLFVAMQVSAFLGLSIFSYQKIICPSEYSIGWPLIVGHITLFTLFGLSARYLYSNSKYHPDKSVHRETN